MPKKSSICRSISNSKYYMLASKCILMRRYECYNNVINNNDIGHEFNCNIVRVLSKVCFEAKKEFSGISEHNPQMLGCRYNYLNYLWPKLYSRLYTMSVYAYLLKHVLVLVTMWVIPCYASMCLNHNS